MDDVEYANPVEIVDPATGYTDTYDLQWVAGYWQGERHYEEWVPGHWRVLQWCEYFWWTSDDGEYDAGVRNFLDALAPLYRNHAREQEWMQGFPNGD